MFRQIYLNLPLIFFSVFAFRFGGFFTAIHSLSRWRWWFNLLATSSCNLKRQTSKANVTCTCCLHCILHFFGLLLDWTIGPCTLLLIMSLIYLESKFANLSLISSGSSSSSLRIPFTRWWQHREERKARIPTIPQEHSCSETGDAGQYLTTSVLALAAEKYQEELDDDCDSGSLDLLSTDDQSPDSIDPLNWAIPYIIDSVAFSGLAVDFLYFLSIFEVLQNFYLRVFNPSVLIIISLSLFILLSHAHFFITFSSVPSSLIIIISTTKGLSVVDWADVLYANLSKDEAMVFFSLHLVRN